MSIKSVVYLGLGIFIGLAVAGHGASLNPAALAQQGAAPCKSAAGTPASKATTHTIKVTLNGDPWQMTVTKVSVASTVKRFSGAVQSAKGKYVFLYVTAQNLGKQSQLLGMDVVTLTVLDSQGRNFDIDISTSDEAASQANSSLLGESVQPTFAIHTVIAFDVAKDAHGLKLQYTDIGSIPQTLLNLGL